MTSSPIARRRPEIDGLRAIAVLMVLFFHAGVPLFGGGFAGVDVFFVISGYLIAGIVLRETESGSFSFAAFYERRVRRIMPALLTMLALASAVSLLLLPEDLVVFGKSLLSTVTFSSNLYFWRSFGYFGIDPQYAPLLNTWSLAVEEQLYLVLPPLLVLVAARFGRRGAAAFIAVSGGLAVFVGLAVVDRLPYAAFFSPVLRAAEFLLGAFLASGGLPLPRSRGVGDALAVLGIALIAGAVPRAHATPFFPWVEVLLACAGAALVIDGTSAPGSRVARVLGARPLVLLGLASYSLYLWHWPFIAFGTYYILDDGYKPAAKIALALASVPVAFLSWRYVERPFRARAVLPSRPAVFLAAAGASLVLALFAVGVVALKGAPERFDPLTRRIVRDEVRVHNPCDGQSARSVADGRLCKLGSPLAPPSFVISGDSHADMYFEALDALARRFGVSGYMFSAEACRAFVFAAAEPADEACAARNAEIRKLIVALKPKAVIIAQRWSTAALARQAALAGDPRGRQWLAQLDDGLGRMARLVRDTGGTLYIARDVPEARVSVTRTLAKARILGLDDPNGIPPPTLALGATRAEFDASGEVANASFAALARRYRIRFLDPAALLCDAQRCRVARGGLPLYRDTHHLNIEGAAYAIAAFEPLMRYLAGPVTRPARSPPP